MSNALHEYAKLFEKYATNGLAGIWLEAEDCLALANEMRIDADIIESENRKLLELNNIRILQTQHCEDLTAKNERMRELLRGLYSFAFQEYPDGVEENFADSLRKLGIEVETDEDW